ncbi:MAG TPA: glycosyltransferase family 4 protein [Terriglobales bacterium]|jgi:glycosyltransferase involved in cell wall biosynthesis|nr:glycosyltransferase family 4 protein [Terriglobales bacterium]
MKLLIYSHFFAPSIGGVENSVQSLATGLQELSNARGAPAFDVTAVTQTPAESFDDSALPFRVVRRPGLTRLWRLVRGSHLLHIAGPALAPLILGFLARKPTVVEHHGYQAICPNGILIYQPDGTICPGHFQARRYGNCVRCQNCELPPHRSVLSVLLTLVRSWLVRGVAKNLAITRHVLDRHNLPHAQVLYYGIPDPVVEGSSGTAKNVAGTISFAFVGRFVPEKGIPVLLQAVRQLIAEGEQFQLWLIGDGPERTRLEGIIKHDQLRDHVHITGYLASAALVDALRNVQVVVMPSVWEETAGLAAIEQMMRGRLVIASDVGGLSEVLADTGLRFAPGDAVALAACMRRALHEPATVETMGREARLRALSLFARPRMIDEHQRVYEEALAGRAAL